MCGPITACIRAGSAPAADIADSSSVTTPAAIPSRPACATPTIRASGSASRTGAQSATSTPSPSPGTSVKEASASGSGCPAARNSPERTTSRPGEPTLAYRTATPCTWRIQASRPSARPHARAVSRRFSATATGSSPTAPPRFSVSYGAALTPPPRPVNRKCTPGASSAGRPSSADPNPVRCSSPPDLGWCSSPPLRGGSVLT